MIAEVDFYRRIRLGEDSVFGMKHLLCEGDRVKAPNRDDFADELAAFANAYGGTLVLGVDDKTREILGIPLDKLDAVEGWVREICNDSIKPPLDCMIRKMELADSNAKLVPVVCIDVNRSLFVHRSPGGYFRRSGSSKREMATEVLARLFQERSQSRVIRFDETVVFGTGIGDLNAALATRFLKDNAGIEETLLRKMRIAAEDDDEALRLTVGGVLLCGNDPQRFLSHAQIQAVSYAGERSDVNYQKDARDIGGTLDVQVKEALHFVRRNQKVHAVKNQSRREQMQFSERAVFEALVNAVAHRDYSMAGARIRLHMFNDRLELYVPGGLANTLTPESMSMRQYSRNELIVSLLARCAVDPDDSLGRTFLMDRRGDGVPIILDESRKLSGRSPEYETIDDSELRLVIWAANIVVSEEDKV
jgi:ATP-dependent DNA helicase RecG